MLTSNAGSIPATVLTSRQPVKAYRVGRVCKGVLVRVEDGQAVEAPCTTTLSRYNSAAYCGPCHERRFRGGDRSLASSLD